MNSVSAFGGVPVGRSGKHTYFEANEANTWQVAQVLVDPEEMNDWKARFEVDLAASRQSGEAVVRMRLRHRHLTPHLQETPPGAPPSACMKTSMSRNT